MHEILLREEDIGRGREHFWIVSLAHDNQILNIELISLGSMNKTIVEPTEVLLSKVTPALLIMKY